MLKCLLLCSNFPASLVAAVKTALKINGKMFGWMQNDFGSKGPPADLAPPPNFVTSVPSASGPDNKTLFISQRLPRKLKICKQTIDAFVPAITMPEHALFHSCTAYALVFHSTYLIPAYTSWKGK